MNQKTTVKQTNPSASTNIAEARRAMSALLPHLPEPRLAEWMTPRGIVLPTSTVFGGPNTLPAIESPTALLAGLGPYSVAALPKHWLAAHEVNKQRWLRTTQLLRLHCCCLRAETGAADVPDLGDCDGVVAGLLLLLIRPCPGKLRTSLMQAACTHPFGAFLAAHGMLTDDEHFSAIESIARDTRLASALVRHDPAAAGHLLGTVPSRNDIWAATVALNEAVAENWLEKVLTDAASDPTAAATAIVLQPSASEILQKQWLSVLKKSPPRFSYEVVRWCRHTWPTPRWIKLREELRARATSDQGQFHCLWHRDIEPEQADNALLNENLEILWAAELTDAVKNFGYALRRHCLLRLKSNPADTESTLALRWLNQRGRPN